MSTFVYSTMPAAPDRRPPHRRRWVRWGATRVATAALFLVAEPTLGVHGAVTATVFVAAVVAWLFGRVDDTYVALAAAIVLVLVGVLPPDELFASLGDDTIWLLIAAFVLAAGIASSGLAARGAVFLAGGATSVRQLAHLVTAALVVTTFAVPATSGRAALAVPVFTALASATVVADGPTAIDYVRTGEFDLVILDLGLPGTDGFTVLRTLREAHVSTPVIILTAREFVLLEMFLRHPSQVLSREQILYHVWGYDFDPGSNIVDVYVRALRRKLGQDRITTIRGMGYALGR